MTIRVWHRGVLWVGLAGTSVFVFVGLWTLVSRVWAMSFTQTLEVLVAGPFLGIWVLSPILWAAWPRREAPPSTGDALVSLIEALLLVGVAAYAYVPEFVVLPMFFDVEPQLESLMLVAIIPVWQWGIVGVAKATRLVRSRQLAILCAAFTAASCTYGPEEERVVVGQIVGLGDSYRALIVTHYERFRPPSGVTAFPDGGKARVLERRARLYSVDASERTALMLTEQVAPDSLWESFALSIRGLVGDSVSYATLTGCPRNGECNPAIQKSLTLRVGISGEVQAVAEVPAEARLPGVMLARREGEEHYVRFGSDRGTVTARFEEDAAYEPILRVRTDGSLTSIGR